MRGFFNVGIGLFGGFIAFAAVPERGITRLGSRKMLVLLPMIFIPAGSITARYVYVRYLAHFRAICQEFCHRSQEYKQALDFISVKDPLD